MQGAWDGGRGQSLGQKSMEREAGQPVLNRVEGQWRLEEAVSIWFLVGNGQESTLIFQSPKSGISSGISNLMVWRTMLKWNKEKSRPEGQSPRHPAPRKVLMDLAEKPRLSWTSLSGLHEHPSPAASLASFLSCLQVLCGSWLGLRNSGGLTLGSSTISPADFFQGKHFFLYGEFPGDERRKLSRYVTAFNGSVCRGGGKGRRGWC